MDSTLARKIGHLQIPLQDVLKATDNFADENIISSIGHFGPAYKGRLLRSGNLIKIAAKRLDPKFWNGHVHFWNEVSVLSDLDHKNVVSIIGFCDEKGEKIIITPSMANGSLLGDLDNPDLTWKQRLKISIGVARALGYLRHDDGRSYGVIHRNINSSTILLDENWEPKLSGFEISIKQSVNRDDRVVLSKPVGTLGYMDPEIKNMKGVTYKSDIYAFGVVLFEILCGRKAFMEDEAHRYLAPLAKCHYENKILEDIIHPSLRNQMHTQSLMKYSEAAYSCLKEDQTHRPDVNNIISQLEITLQLQLGLSPPPLADVPIAGIASPVQSITRNMDSTLARKIGHLQIPLEDVLVATDNFADENIISSIGDFGPAYKGRLLWSGNLIKIAAKRLDPKLRNGHVHFWNEVSMLSDLDHENVISIIGFCDEKGEKIIITPSMANGSLQGDLDNPDLTWKQRLMISIGVARALGYLCHDEGRSYGVIHRNINSSTILLDENWEAKLSGFGMSIKQSVNRADHVIISEPIGTLGYLDQEIKKRKGVTHKSDIYAFGVVLFEILCGRKAFIEEEAANRFLAELAKCHYENNTLEDIIHPYLRSQIYPQSLVKYSEVAYSCLNEDQTHRPDVNDIISRLERTMELELGLEKIEKKGLQHLKISLGVILLTSDNFSERYKSGHSIDIIEYIVERDHFDKEKPSSKEGKNRGELPKIHKNVLIKRFLRTSEKQEEFFFTEIEILTSINHRNIVTPIGFCVEGSEMVLVFEIPTNGYLRDYLTGRREICILTWEKRLKICIDVAHALNYLHYEMEDKKVIIHTNICSWKFELDENWGAKIDDYQTAVFRPSNQEDEAFYQNKVVGTKYYRDPEHEKTGMLTRKSDVYSFGVVLFEILCGKLAIDPNYLKSHEGGLAPLARRNFGTEKLENMIDPIIKDETNKDSLHSFIEIAYQCVAETQDQRPTMKVVVKELEKALSFQVSQEKQGQQQDKNPVVDQKANHEISVRSFFSSLHLFLLLKSINVNNKNARVCKLKNNNRCQIDKPLKLEFEFER